MMEKVRLGDLCKFENGDRGKNYPSQSSFVLEGIPFINTGNLEKKQINTSNFKYITEEHFNRINSGKILPNDILFCLRGSLGKFALNKNVKRGAIASSLVIIRAKENLDQTYLAHFFSSPICKRLIAKSDNGSSQPNLSATSVKNFQIPLPPLSEQKKIAAILDEADRIRQINQSLLDEYDDLTQALFLDMFGDPVLNPKGWEIFTLGEIASINMGQSPKGNSYNSNGKGTPLLNGPTEFGTQYPTEKQWTTEPKKLCSADDILFCVRGATAGKMNWADKTYCIGRGLAAIKSKGEVSDKYIYMILNMLYDIFQNTSNGSTFINISKNDLHQIKIPKTPLKLQTEFATRIQAIEAQKAQAQAALAESEDLFNALLQRAFKGELTGG